MAENEQQARKVEQILSAQPAIEGAGVHLRRAFGQGQVPRLDPFLLLDDLRSENPVEFAAGFPWHPHRGIETVTYVLGGRVDHEDSLGNKGAIGAGDVQWMTAGSGIIHQEMPRAREGMLNGFQLWVNLPADQKMRDPRYQEVSSAAVAVSQPRKGVTVRVVAGRVHGVEGPVRDIAINPTLLDVSMAPQSTFEHTLPADHRAFAYTLEGRATFDEARNDAVDSEHLVVLGPGRRARIETGPKPARFLFAAGKPLNQPVAWWGPIVMNNHRQLEQAILEFQDGTFIKHAPAARAPTTRPHD